MYFLDTVNFALVVDWRHKTKAAEKTTVSINLIITSLKMRVEKRNLANKFERIIHPKLQCRQELAVGCDAEKRCFGGRDVVGDIVAALRLRGELPFSAAIASSIHYTRFDFTIEKVKKRQLTFRKSE